MVRQWAHAAHVLPSLRCPLHRIGPGKAVLHRIGSGRVAIAQAEGVAALGRPGAILLPCLSYRLGGAGPRPASEGPIPCAQERRQKTTPSNP